MLEAAFIEARRSRPVNPAARDAARRYGVMAMAPGPWPVLTGARAVLVAIRIGVTVPESKCCRANSPPERLYPAAGEDTAW